MAFRRKLMGNHPKHLARAGRRGRAGRLEQARAQGLHRGVASSWATAAMSRPPRKFRERRQQDQAASHRGGDRSGLRGQSGADRAAGRGLFRLRPVRRCSTAASPSRTAASSRPISTPTTRCGSSEMPKVEIDRHAERRLLGRRRRADHLRRRARRAQRLFRGDGQAHSLRAAQQRGHRVGATRDGGLVSPKSGCRPYAPSPFRLQPDPS